MKIIIGGGIAGLWLAAEYKALGIPFALLEKNSLGFSQTLASQGIIHGGTKYSLTGAITNSTKAISLMPKLWRNSINGIGNVKLDKKILEQDYQFLWSSEKISTKVIGFFASKLMNSKLEKINQEEEKIFSKSQDKLNLYKLNEPIINVKKTIETLYDQIGKNCYKCEVKKIVKKNGVYQTVITNFGNLEASQIILLAGEGSEEILSNSGILNFKIQKRPLAMPMVFIENKIPKLYGHYFGIGSKPIMTISSHISQNGTVLYIGGDIAETGVLKSDREQKLETKQILKQLLPWLDLNIKKIKILRINRIEPFSKFKRPDLPFVEEINNLIVGWPIKLAFAPLLAKTILEKNITFSKEYNFKKMFNVNIGKYPWD